MKRRFILYASKRFKLAGMGYVHGRLKALRKGEWSVVGVFQLTEGEWEELAEYCHEAGIEVGDDVDEPIPA